MDDDIVLSAPLFAGMDPDQTRVLQASLTPLDAVRGEVLFHEGERGDRLYVIERGKIKLGRRSNDGRENLLAVLGPGEMFGELSLFDPGPRTATATVVADARVQELGHQDLVAWLQTNPAVAKHLLQALARRLRRTNEALADLVFSDVPGRVAKALLDLSTRFGEPVDDGLRAILLRALARDPLQRHPSATVFRGELVKWSAAGFTAAGFEAKGAGSNSTLEFLLRRMRHKSDFPALSDAVVRIQGMANSEKESVGSVTNEILKDVALTNKLLRLVNSAHYSRGSSIGTVSRAVSLVGFNGIRNMALSLVLLEHMQDKAHANVLKEEFLRSLMAGSIAVELCPLANANEEAFICAMFHNLGRLLAAFYFPEEAHRIRGLVASARQAVSEASASVSVLGLSFEALGVGVAKAWGLPEGIRNSMQKPVGDPPAKVVVGSAEHQRWTAIVANEISCFTLNPRSSPANWRP